MTTDGPAQPRGCDTMRQWMYVQTAARKEAVQLGDTEVAVEHVLLALLVNGGPSARLLADAGVNLTRLRAAAQELRRTQPGVPDEDRPAAAESLPAAAEQEMAAVLPTNPALRALMQSAVNGALLGDDRDLLVTLLTENGGRAALLLRLCGTEPEALLEGSTRTPSPVDPSRGERQRSDQVGRDLGLDDLGPASAGGRWVSAGLAYPAVSSPGPVWSLVSDPVRLPAWDPSCTTVTLKEDATQQVTSTKDGTELQQTRAADDTLQQVTWTRTAPGHQAAEWVLRIRVDPSANGSTLYLQHAIVGRGPWRRWPLHRLAQRLLRNRLRVLAQNILRATSRLDPGTRDPARHR